MVGHLKCRLRWARHMALLASSIARGGRPSLAGLGWPQKGFRVDQASNGDVLFFNTIDGKQAEDALRADGLETAVQLTAAKQVAARTLAKQLAWGAAQNDPPSSLASSEYMRF